MLFDPSDNLSAVNPQSTMNESLMKSQLRGSVVVEKQSTSTYSHGMRDSLLQTYAHPHQVSQSTNNHTSILSDRPKTSLQIQ